MRAQSRVTLRKLVDLNMTARVMKLLLLSTEYLANVGREKEYAPCQLKI